MNVIEKDPGVFFEGRAVADRRARRRSVCVRKAVAKDPGRGIRRAADVQEKPWGLLR